MTQHLNSNCTQTIKFLYNYGGKIVPSPIDGKLHYAGGFTRVMSVDRLTTFEELKAKFEESRGVSMNLKFKLPSKDLDVLVSITCDDDLKTVIGEYDRLSPETKITAVLFPIREKKPPNKISHPHYPMSSFDFPSALRKPVPAATECYRAPPTYRCFSPAVGFPAMERKYNCYQERNIRHFCYAQNMKYSRPQQVQKSRKIESQN